MTNALWIVQALLALLFLFAGGMKLGLPVEELTLIPLVVGLLVAFIAYGRWWLAPLPGSARPPAFRSAS